MNVVILHAYSRLNSGDGLLVDEAAELVREAFPTADISLVAMAPETFPEFASRQNPVGGPSLKMSVPNLVRTLLSGRPHPSVVSLIESADLAVAVGGGYLRASSLKGLAKTVISQLSQAPTASSSTPYVYLPQSIGPFPLFAGLLGIKRLRHAKAVFVRDDRSLADAKKFGIAAIRMPDLAALAVASNHTSFRERLTKPSRPVGIVGRSLGAKNAHYEKALLSVIRETGGELLVQSEGRGNNDPSFYTHLGFDAPWRGLLPALSSEDQRPEVVLSVRLHGSLQSILAGVPSVHLSYERKGWGAYDDLGISRYVHNARTFDTALVLDQLEELREDPSSFWKSIDGSKPTLLRAREEISMALKRVGGAKA